MIYPKKVTSLKKRPTKSPTTTSTTMPTATTTTLGTISQTMKPKSKVSTAMKTKTTNATPTVKTKQTIATGDVTETFKNLPADDLEFIKALDKQFKLHGDKIKFKVEHDNTTNTKNSKRTIDGELGYGYAHNGYEYNPPKFMFYPYSQEDIPATESYYTKYEKTSVTIEPSYSYELKPQTSYETHANDQPQIDLPQQQQQHQQQQHDDVDVSVEHQQQPQQQPQQQQHGEAGYEEPVIVLRIPGPAKYATHLQTLLQQYLEIRAAQYLSILEEAEQRKQQHTQQEHSHEQHYETTPLEYQAPAPHSGIELEEGHKYAQEVAYGHQLAPTPQPVSYPAIDDVYHSYKGRHQQQQHQQQQQQHLQQQHQQVLQQEQSTDYYGAPQQQHQHQQVAYHGAQEVPQYYYVQQSQLQYQPQHQQSQQQQHHQYAETELPTEHVGYQPHVYLIAMSPQHQYGEPIDVQPHQQQIEQHQHQQHHQHQQPIYVQDDSNDDNSASQHDITDAAGLPPISENSPRQTHTKVIFTSHNDNGGGADYTSMYPLPSIRPYERHAPTSTPSYHQHYHHQHQQQHQLQHQQQQQQAESDSATGAIIDYQHAQTASVRHQETVAITQRPFNYHAHALKMSRLRSNGGGPHKRGTATVGAAPAAPAATTTTTMTTTAAEADQRLQQIRRFVREKLGAEMGSTVEIKTTQVVKG